MHELEEVPWLSRPWVRAFGTDVLDLCRNHMHQRLRAAEARVREGGGDGDGGEAGPPELAEAQGAPAPDGAAADGAPAEEGAGAHARGAGEEASAGAAATCPASGEGCDEASPAANEQGAAPSGKVGGGGRKRARRQPERAPGAQPKRRRKAAPAAPPPGVAAPAEAEPGGGVAAPPPGTRVRVGAQLAHAATPALASARPTELLALLAEARGGASPAVPCEALAAAAAVRRAGAAASNGNAALAEAAAEGLATLRRMAAEVLPAWEVRRVLACRALAADPGGCAGSGGALPRAVAAAVLRIPLGASQLDARSAYRRLSLVVHPDKNWTPGARARAGEEGREARGAAGGSCLWFACCEPHAHLLPLALARRLRGRPGAAGRRRRRAGGRRRLRTGGLTRRRRAGDRLAVRPWVLRDVLRRGTCCGRGRC